MRTTTMIVQSILYIFGLFLTSYGASINSHKLMVIGCAIISIIALSVIIELVYGFWSDYKQLRKR